MRIIADLQIHSRFARATSKNITLANLEKGARLKGLDLIGTGDFQHPLWRKEIDNELKEDDKGILWSASGFPFLWQTEVSLMFSQGGKRRAVHVLIFAPNKPVADKITGFLGSKGRLDYDGRPIFGMSCIEIVRELKKIDELIEIIPAHCLLPDERIICNPSVKPISEIKTGDKVLTHLGRYKSVIQSLKRNYNGKAYRIQPYYFKESIKTTDNHPFFAIKTIKNCSAVGGMCKPNSMARGKHACKAKHYESYRPSWIMAENLEVNDVLVYPRPMEIVDIDKIDLLDYINKSDYVIKGELVYPNIGRQNKGVRRFINISSDFCRLIGYYLSEGYVIPKNNCIQFSFAQHESNYIEDVISLMKDYFGLSIAKKREKNGYELYFYSKPVVNLFRNIFYNDKAPLRAYSKRVPQWMMNLSMHKQAELFKGWWRGDAGTTVSETLAQQMKLICLRLGIVPNVYCMKKEQQNSYQSKISDRLIVASHDLFTFQHLSFFEDLYNLLDDPLFRRFKSKLERKHGWIDNSYAYIPIKKIESFDYIGEVYDLQVEEDHSFVTPSATVHNCMTPWFGLFGSDSGFDSIQECFGEETRHIYAIESGMSADPAMLWRMKQNVNIVSFSDAHSHHPWRIGREATIFDIDELSYVAIIQAIRTGEGLVGTIETPPEYGKYHWSGHRNCNFSCSPAETARLKGICPVCGKGLTIGVDDRVEKLAQEKAGFKPHNAKPFYRIVPLHELLAFYLNTAMTSKKVQAVYNELSGMFGNEFNILLNVGKEELLGKKVDGKLSELILLHREGKLGIKPGYDGVYGVLQLPEAQKKLF